MYVRKLTNNSLTLERFIWYNYIFFYLGLSFDMSMTVSSIEGYRVPTATTSVSIAGFICRIRLLM